MGCREGGWASLEGRDGGRRGARRELRKSTGEGLLSIEDVRAKRDESRWSPPISGMDMAGMDGKIRQDHRPKFPALTAVCVSIQYVGFRVIRWGLRYSRSRNGHGRLGRTLH